MILIRWVDGIKAIVEEVRAAAKKFPTAVEYGWEVLKSSGIEWVDGDFIDDLVAGYFSGETGHEPTSASRFAISAQGHFVQALQLGAIDIVRYLVQETLGGYQLQLFHHLDGRLNDERKKQDFAAEYKGFKAAERFAGKAGGVGGRVRSGRKQTEFNPEICFWSFYAAKAGETKALEYLTSDEVREDVRAFIKKRAAAKDPRALELKDAPTLERFLDHALSMTDNSRGTNKATLLHAVMTASPTSKLLVALESFVGPLSYHLMLNQPDGKGYTPLFYAAIHAVPRRVLATLIRQGADPLVTEPKRGWTAFHMLVHNDASARKLLDTFLAVVPPATVMQLMSAKSNMYGHTPLMLATIEGNHAAVKTLLAFMKTHGKRTLGGAEALPFAADVAGMSPVHWAVAKNHTAILKLMHDALPAAPAWRAENADGTTPAARVLHSARMNIFYRTAKPKLVEAFADPFKEVEVRELDPVDLDDETIDETKETYTVTRATQYKDTTGSTYHLVKAAGLLDPTKLADRAIAQMSDVQAVVGMMGKVLRQGEIDYAADQELRNGYANVSF
ncbi:hypothetical protein BC828DRAFT_384397 [Blastocladiella britannica]|nr:hypothetical protein BC828DRAFT_384397 [Blastocladiella britannica]